MLRRNKPGACMQFQQMAGSSPAQDSDLLPPSYLIAYFVRY
jgi:hypothetical protein